MKPVDIFIRYSDQNVCLDKIATLSHENNLIYNDEGEGTKAHFLTSLKFTTLSLASPLISLARLVRSVYFAFKGEFDSTGREFVGAITTPLVGAGCLMASLLSSAVYVLSSGKVSFYVSARRTYALFEAWINKIDFQAFHLASYSQRVSGPMDWFKSRIWTTAPCMQPLLENGFSRDGGVLDLVRIQKIFPFVKVNDVCMERNQVVIQSEYENENIDYVGCNGAYKHKKISRNCCCCFRIETVYDRILCCEVEQGKCTSIANSGDGCGIVSCGCCGMGACCCYTKEDHNVTSLNTGCFGPQGFSCIPGLLKVPSD